MTQSHLTIGMGSTAAGLLKVFVLANLCIYLMSLTKFAATTGISSKLPVDLFTVLGQKLAGLTTNKALQMGSCLLLAFVVLHGLSTCFRLCIEMRKSNLSTNKPDTTLETGANLVAQSLESFVAPVATLCLIASAAVATISSFIQKDNVTGGIFLALLLVAVTSTIVNEQFHPAEEGKDRTVGDVLQNISLAPVLGNHALKEKANSMLK